MGVYLTHKIGTLWGYRSNVIKEASSSPLAEQIPSLLPEWHAPFASLYDLVREARNDALHVGAFARHLTRHAIELSLVLEDALMAEAVVARDFMVEGPICASAWQPLSSIRSTMLANSFSYLPVILKLSKDGLPVLVLGSDGDLRGIVTPFDVL